MAEEIKEQDSGRARIIVRVESDLRVLIPGYLTRRREDLDLLRTSVEQGDLDVVRSCGHKMKGSGGGYGLDRISEIGAALEAAGKTGDVDVAGRHVEELAQFLDRLQVVYVDTLS